MIMKGKVMADLREHEAKTLRALKKLGGKASVEQIIQETGLPDAASNT
jgi:hypothetical protein